MSIRNKTVIRQKFDPKLSSQSSFRRKFLQIGLFGMDFSVVGQVCNFDTSLSHQHEQRRVDMLLQNKINLHSIMICIAVFPRGTCFSPRFRLISRKFSAIRRVFYSFQNYVKVSIKYKKSVLHFDKLLSLQSQPTK